MPFVPDTDVNYQLYKTAVNAATPGDAASYTETTPVPASRLPEFNELLIEYFSLQCTNGATLVNTTTMTAAIAAAKASLFAQVRDF